MPPRPTWLRRLPDAIAQLEGLAMETVTRHELEVLLVVSKRRAVQLMHAWGAERRGGQGDLQVERTRLLRQWRLLRRGRRYEEEEQRVTRVATHLREARISRITVTVPGETIAIRLAGLPTGVVIEPRRIVVDFADAQDAIAKLFAVAQALGNDWDRFEALVMRGG